MLQFCLRPQNRAKNNEFELQMRVDCICKNRLVVMSYLRITLCVCSLLPPAGRRDSGRPPPELHLVARSRRPHSQRHREHPAVRPHRPSAGQQDQRSYHSPLQVCTGSQGPDSNQYHCR